MPRKLTTDEFVKQAKLTHGERYDYSITEYINRRTKVKIICPTHGIFEQHPDTHLHSDFGCPRCGGTGKLTTEIFIEKAREIHCDKYDYSRVSYTNNITKVEIICRIHGPFWQKPAYHLGGSNCPSCVGHKRWSPDEFIKAARIVHGNKYDYSFVVFSTTKDKVKITCPIHGSFWQIPDTHIWKKRGCPYCGGTGKLTIEMFIKKSAEIHDGKYDYSKSIYTGNKSKLEIICPQHGSFWQVPNSHLSRSSGCPTCTGNKRLDTEEFIKRAKDIHGDRYDYSKADFITVADKVEVICSIHGSFWVTPNNHIRRQSRCPSCERFSTGEEAIAKILKRWGIIFTRQKRFEKCRDRGYLPFDFYFQLYDISFLVEYDGIQHFEAIGIFGGQEALERNQRRDIIKNQFAQKYDFCLIRIPYWEYKNIEFILQDEIEKHTGESIDKITRQQQKRTRTIRFNPIRYKQIPLI